SWHPRLPPRGGRPADGPPGRGPGDQRSGRERPVGGQRRGPGDRGAAAAGDGRGAAGRQLRRGRAGRDRDRLDRGGGGVLGRARGGPHAHRRRGPRGLRLGPRGPGADQPAGTGAQRRVAGGRGRRAPGGGRRPGPPRRPAAGPTARGGAGRRRPRLRRRRLRRELADRGVAARGAGEGRPGAPNGSGAVRLVATATAADSQYQRIVTLVQEAQESRAPFVRLADRVAVPFTATAFLIAGLAWGLSGDPMRFAQVLVVATPCPLIIAAPVAFMAGMSRGARGGMIVKDAGTLEQLSKVR